MIKNKPAYPLTTTWLSVVVLGVIQIIYILSAHFMPLNVYPDPLENDQREFIRSFFYMSAIIIFPLTSLIRHIQKRVIQTIPKPTPLGKRYLLMIIISQLMIGIIGLLGFIIFILGDDFNSLYMFSLMAFLGFFLHRPQLREYQNLNIHD